jgi:hypothetical protein
MVGTRIAPDNNDIVVWKLDEATAPFVNSSTSTNAISTANSNLTTISGTGTFTQQPGLFGNNSCVLFNGNNSGSPRNFISGAVNTQPQPPLTVSGWVFLRTYSTHGFTYHLITRQHTVNVWFGPFSSMQIENRTYASQTQQWDFSINTTTTQGGNALVSSEYTIPQNVWSHVGWTYDGTTVQAYINGNLVSSGTASPTGNVSYGNGPWFFGAIPGGSGNPEEAPYSVCDVRIANVVRPQSYFQNIYRNGVLNDPTNISVVTRFYKMRAYDIHLKTRAVYWVDINVNYDNAPASPSGLGLGPIEIVESWTMLNT